MRLVISGAAGFVGINLAQFIVGNKQMFAVFKKIILVDNLLYKKQSFPSDILSYKKFEFIKASIYDVNVLRRVIKKDDVVLHLATEVNTYENPQNSVSTDPEEYLKILLNKRISKFIFVSTADIYGANNSSDLTETDVVKPTTLYSASKVAFEALLQAYFGLYTFPVVIFRPVTIYGPHQFPGWLVPRVIIRALKNQAIQITGKGKVKRDWIFVNDVCKILSLAILSKRKDIYGEVFNLGSGTEETVLEVVDFILSRLGKPKSLIQFVSPRAGEIERQITSATKAKKIFNWKPTTVFFKGLDMTVDWYKNNYK
jgi:dTDP-glucose 4,6-dehydratase